MIENEVWAIKQSSKTINKIREIEPENWLQDNITIAFDKRFFDEKQVLEQIKFQQKNPPLSTIWKKSPIEHEMVIFVSKARSERTSDDNLLHSGKFVDDASWIASNPDELQRYLNKYVAISKNKILGYGDTPKEAYDMAKKAESSCEPIIMLNSSSDLF